MCSGPFASDGALVHLRQRDGQRGALKRPEPFSTLNQPGGGVDGSAGPAPVSHCPDAPEKSRSVGTFLRAALTRDSR